MNTLDFHEFLDRSGAASDDTGHIYDLVRAHQSTGRAFLFTMMGATDAEVSAAGAWITGVTGERYLDLGSFSVFLLGHNHPVVIGAVRAQLERMAGSSRAIPSAVNANAAAAAAALAPKGLDKVMFLNGGSEVVDAAIKLARARTGREGIAHLEHSYHGKTLGALSITDAAVFREPAMPLIPGIVRLDRKDAGLATEAILATRPAAVFAEPIQGEGGVFVLGRDYLAALRAACDEAGSLLVYDEIQCGLGRSGERWAGADAVRPDILLAGKALGGGVIPVSALIASVDAFGPFDRDPLLHSSTFGGNPLASAAVLAATQVLVDDEIAATSQRLGAVLSDTLEALVACHDDLFTAVSGQGLLRGLHCRTAEIAGEFLRACHGERVLLTPCITTPSVIRVVPPAVVQAAELTFAAAALDRAAVVARASLGVPSRFRHTNESNA